MPTITMVGEKLGPHMQAQFHGIIIGSRALCPSKAAETSHIFQPFGKDSHGAWWAAGGMATDVDSSIQASVCQLQT